MRSRAFSLRDFTGPAQPPQRRDLGSSIDDIMRQAAAPQPTERTTPVRSEILDDIHGPRDVANRIAGLKAQGIEQLGAADVKAMKPDQIVQAQHDGRLLTYMTGITAPASEG